MLKKYGLYPDERRAEIIDFDWTYRKLGLGIAKWIGAMWTRLGLNVTALRKRFIDNAGKRLYQIFSPAGAMSAAAPSGLAAVLTAGMLVIALLIMFITSI